jgi:hypothetical protein
MWLWIGMHDCSMFITCLWCHSCCYKPVYSAVVVCSCGMYCTNSRNTILLCTIMSLLGTNLLWGDKHFRAKLTPSVSGCLLSLLWKYVWGITIITNCTSITKAWCYRVCMCENISHCSVRMETDRWNVKTIGVYSSVVRLFIWEYFNVKLCCSGTV